ncbi:type I pullulanase [Gracilibacillus massiliensis]|uniref:type I pullulanase n=1 Tax=Gracilibacillus massiliensis TaxID=1564956 RepID=UPI00071DFD21|nr:type I pullulanase [Gracilibacillus massiliensis]
MERLVAWLDEKDRITIEENLFDDCRNHVPEITVGKDEVTIRAIEYLSKQKINIFLDCNLPIGEDAFLRWGENCYSIYPREVVRSVWFDQTYDASNELLGNSYSKEATTFSVWAPTATNVMLILNKQRLMMKRKENGVWYNKVTGDIKDCTYQFAVKINGEERLVNDPYAKSMTANSEECVVVDLESTDPKNFRTTIYPKVYKKDAIIYELHVRDATSCQESGVQQKGKFLGLTEKNTSTTDGYSTALHYVSELGCTHVQLLPIQDFARVDELQPEKSYNWGYDPLYFMVPEGSYATDVNNPSCRVKECKQMINSFHKEGISVILDVVFNHVFDHENSVLEKLVPGYYFRYHENGDLSNGSGTGNDLATERKMVRKLILDTVDYWLREYLVDGFRFDLMGLIDIDTMQVIYRRCQLEARPIFLLGEGWDLNTPLPPTIKATIAQSDQIVGISQFNDRFRDVVKGYDLINKGFVNGDGHYLEDLPQIVSGSSDLRFGNRLFSRPLQSINYVECHDNHTLADWLLKTNPEAAEEDRKRMHQLATGLTILSQGIPFIHAGQEFFRTKYGDENSYISGDAINQLDWKKRVEENENIKWVQQLISLRKQYNVFRLDSAKKIQERFHVIKTPQPVFGYMLFGKKEDFVVFVNPSSNKMNIRLPATGRWEKISSNYSSSNSPICCSWQGKGEVEAYELAIWKKRRNT